MTRYVMTADSIVVTVVKSTVNKPRALNGSSDLIW